MKKIITSILFLFLCCVYGCVDLSQKTSITADGSGSMDIMYSTSMKNFGFGYEVGEFPFEETLIREKFSGDGITINSIDVSDNMLDSVRTVEVDLSFADIRKINSAQMFSKLRVNYNVSNDEIDFLYVIPQDTSVAYNFDAVKSRMNYEFELPAGEITCTNGKVSGNKLIFNRRVSDLYDDVSMFAKIRRY